MIIEWEHSREVQWLGQTDTTTETVTRQTAAPHEGMSTGDKILIVSLLINALGLAWQIYQWRRSK